MSEISFSGGSASANDVASRYPKKQYRQAKISQKVRAVAMESNSMNNQSELASHPVHVSYEPSMDLINQFLDKKPKLPEIMEFIEKEAQRIASEQMKAQGVIQ